MWSSYDEKTDNERYLEQQLEDAQRREEDARQQEKEAREQRKREWEQAVEEVMRTAKTWPEALQKQEFLFRREANFDIGDPDYIDDWFAPGANACKQALEYWHEESEKVADEIKELEEKITALRAGIAGKVADRLDSHEGMLDGWYHVARDLREYDEDDLDRWLYW